MNLLLIVGLNPASGIPAVIQRMVTPVRVGEAELSIERIFSHAHKQEHQGRNHKRDRTHGEQNKRQSSKASFARPMRVSQRLVAKRLNALAHRFEGGHHDEQCTPVRRYARKCDGGAQ